VNANKKYKNMANSDHPATIIYLVDISGSMEGLMPNGKSRIEVAKDAIQTAYTTMIQRSLRQGKIHPRYRIGMIAYTDELYDVYGDTGTIITIDKIKDLGVPAITPQKGTNMAKAFRYAAKLIQDDINTWSQKWLDECPPPVVMNITDCEYDEETQDPVAFAQNIQNISIPDGNVLVMNIFITDQIALPSNGFKEWRGYFPNESTGDPYGDKLLSISSLIPQSYGEILQTQMGWNVKSGAAMMFPGINQEFIKAGIVASTITGVQTSWRRISSSLHEIDDVSDKQGQIEIARPEEEWEKTMRESSEAEKTEIVSKSILQRDSENGNRVQGTTTINNVFISYSHADSRFLQRLLIHLRPLEKKGLIDLWADTKIQVGDIWRDQIANALDCARVAVLLITADFMASDFIIDNELPPLLEKAEARGVTIIPVILKACRFERDKNLNRFQAINNPKSPLVSLSNNDQEKLYDKIVQVIEEMIDI